MTDEVMFDDKDIFDKMEKMESRLDKNIKEYAKKIITDIKE